MDVRTNIVIDEDLLEEAQKVTGIKTKRQVVHEALRVLIRTRKRKSLLDLFGKIEFYPGFDHKKLRQGR